MLHDGLCGKLSHARGETDRQDSVEGSAVVGLGGGGCDGSLSELGFRGGVEVVEGSFPSSSIGPG